jgi:hypothetical protein
MEHLWAGRSPAENVGSNPTGAWRFVCCECRVLSGRGLCDELITRPDESYRLWCVVVCDLETSRIGAPYLYDISSLRAKLDAVSLYFTAVAQLQILKTMQHVSHLLRIEFFVTFSLVLVYHISFQYYASTHASFSLFNLFWLLTNNELNVTAHIYYIQSIFFHVVSVVCCQVEVSATSWSLVQRSHTDCDASLCVI